MGDYIAEYGEDLGIEFGKVRIIEVLGGDPDWQQNSVSYHSLTNGRKYEKVFNEQMIYDVAPAKPGRKTYITISRPVLQRMLDGKTKGLLIRPLGALNCSFYDSEDDKHDGPKLHFNISQ